MRRTMVGVGDRLLGAFLGTIDAGACCTDYNTQCGTYICDHYCSGGSYYNVYCKKYFNCNCVCNVLTGIYDHTQYAGAC